MCSSLNPCIGAVNTSLFLRPGLWCGSPVFQSSSCSDLSYQGVTVFQGSFGNCASTACQNSVNLQIHSNSVQVSGNAQP
jgi:hypothetical protein